MLKFIQAVFSRNPQTFVQSGIVEATRGLLNGGDARLVRTLHWIMGLALAGAIPAVVAYPAVGYSLFAAVFMPAFVATEMLERFMVRIKPLVLAEPVGVEILAYAEHSSDAAQWRSSVLRRGRELVREDFLFMAQLAREQRRKVSGLAASAL